MWFLENAFLIPLIPAVSFVVILAVGKRLPYGGAEVGIGAVGAAFVLASGTAIQWIQRVEDAAAEHGESALGGVGAVLQAEEETPVHAVVETVTWWQSGGVTFEVGTMIDGLAAMMVVTVSLVALLVHVYSYEYLRDDRRFTHYYAFLSLFTASMLMLVVAENTLQMLVGWELVGLCSYVLIGHWWEDRDNGAAALKAFLTNRVGDVGLIIGVIVLFFGAGTFNIIDINTAAVEGEMTHLVLLVASVALLAAVISKSGQFPLHTWLPDAMAGPTPVSALIHAATMVVAGVFLVARLYPVFFEGFAISTSSINLLAFVGAFTTIIGAVLAFVQKDIKRVLAYSTISQLGYMVMALGVGAWTAATFHLFTHAMFKACLFLGAGSVSHASHHTFDMFKMGGLRKYTPHTLVTFLVGSLALAGIPPLAGFWSKDEILAGSADGQMNPYTVMLIMGAVTALLTAAYMTRAIYLTFFGEYRGEGTPHESNAWMLGPMYVLAGLTAVIGVANLPSNLAPDVLTHKFETWVQPTVAFPELAVASFSWTVALLSVVVATTGIGLAGAYYFAQRGPHGLTERNPLAAAGYRFLDQRYYLDHLYTDVIVGSMKGPVARGVYWFDQHVIDAAVNRTATLTRRAGRFVYDRIDQTVIDGAVNATGAGAEGSGQVLRQVQTGRVRQYATLLFAGATVLAGLFVIIL